MEEYLVEIRGDDGELIAEESVGTMGAAIKFADDNQRQNDTVVISIFYRDCEGKRVEVEPVIMWSKYEYRYHT